MTHKLVLATLAALTVLACPSVASAGELRSWHVGTMYVDYYTSYTGKPGERNDMRIEGRIDPTGLHGSTIRFNDLNGIEEVQADDWTPCTGTGGISYECGYRGHVYRDSHTVTVDLGDGDDKLALRQTNYEADRLANQEQDCPMFSNKCVEIYSLDAGPGNDYLDVADGVNEPNTVHCGDGLDTVLADTRDLIASDCEQVSRSKATAAPARGGTLSGPRLNPESPGSDHYEYRYIGTPGVDNDMRIDRPVDGGFSENGNVIIADLTLISSAATQCTGAPLRYDCPFDAQDVDGLHTPDTLEVLLGDGDDRVREYDEAPAACFDQPDPNPWRCPTITIDTGSGNDYIDLQDDVKSSARVTSCGAGYDIVHLDAADAPAPADCEGVTTG